MVLFYCVKIAYLLILWNEPFVQAEQTTTPDKVLHRRASGPTPYDIRNVYLEPYEDLESNIMPADVICKNSIYQKYQNDYSRLDEIELTKEQLDELFYNLLFVTVTRFMIDVYSITSTFISVKNFPDGMRYNLESNYVDNKPKFLIGNKLNLAICRRERFRFNYKFIITNNRETIPPLKELVETPISLKPLGSGPYDIRNVYLEPFEDLKEKNSIYVNIFCTNSIYSKYVNSNPSLEKIELTNGQLEELFYDLLPHLDRTFSDLFVDWSVSVKNFPDGIRYNLESKTAPNNRKLLEGNYLNLKACRDDRKKFFPMRMILTKNRVPFPPLIELTKTTPISTSTSQTTASQVKTFPTKMTTFQTEIPPVQTFPTEMTTSQTKESSVQTFPTQMTTVQTKESSVQTFSTQMTTSQTKESSVQTFPTKKTTTEVTQTSLKTTSTDPPIIQDCSVDMFVKRNMTTMTENFFSKNDWIPALHNYNKVDRPSCLSKPTQQLSTCLCTVNRNLKTWVCEDQNLKAMEAVLNASWNYFFTAVIYYREVFDICIELALIIE